MLHSQKDRSARQRLTAISLAFALSLSAGCTWVPLSPEGDAVRVKSADEIASCEKLGTTSGTVLNKVLFVRRSRTKVRSELLAQARNRAAKMGGDTVAASGEEVDANQSFGVYRCDA